jgi:hypothetical protein
LKASGSWVAIGEDLAVDLDARLGEPADKSAVVMPYWRQPALMRWIQSAEIALFPCGRCNCAATAVDREGRGDVVLGRRKTPRPAEVRLAARIAATERGARDIVFYLNRKASSA